MDFKEFYSKLINILEIYKFVLDSKVCPQTSSQEWLKIISFMYLNDLLWIITNNNKIEAVIGAYRLNEFDEIKANDIPSKNEGSILFIPFACSISNDLLVWRKLLKEYIKIHDINELVFCDYSKDGFGKYRKFNIKGVIYESAKT